jgi:multisubunit Na+/H+ antiporter MnhE subunit
MGKYDADGIDFRFAALVFTFVVGAIIDWIFYHPSRTHWLGVGAAFVLLAISLTVDNTETRAKRIESKLDACLEQLQNLRRMP